MDGVDFTLNNSAQSPDIGKNSNGGIFVFRISGQSLIKSRTSDDIDMKPGPVTKLDKRNTATLKQFDNYVMSANWDAIAIFPIDGQFGAIWKLDFRCMVCKTYIFINFLSYKNRKQISKILNTDLILLLWVKVLFLSKNAGYLQKTSGISKTMWVLVQKGIFSETTCGCTFMTNFRFLA